MFLCPHSGIKSNKCFADTICAMNAVSINKMAWAKDKAVIDKVHKHVRG